MFRCAALHAHDFISSIGQGKRFSRLLTNRLALTLMGFQFVGGIKTSAQ
jgi:hypothetical protein